MHWNPGPASASPGSQAHAAPTREKLTTHDNCKGSGGSAQGIGSRRHPPPGKPAANHRLPLRLPAHSTRTTKSMRLWAKPSNQMGPAVASMPSFSAYASTSILHAAGMPGCWAPQRPSRRSAQHSERSSLGRPRLNLGSGMHQHMPQARCDQRQSLLPPTQPTTHPTQNTRTHALLVVQPDAC